VELSTSSDRFLLFNNFFTALLSSSKQFLNRTITPDAFYIIVNVICLLFIFRVFYKDLHLRQRTRTTIDSERIPMDKAHEIRERKLGSSQTETLKTISYEIRTSENKHINFKFDIPFRTPEESIPLTNTTRNLSHPIALSPPSGGGNVTFFRNSSVVALDSEFPVIAEDSKETQNNP